MNEKQMLPDKYIIPKDRIPKPWSQGLYDCCVAASITKVLEVINYVKTGKYTMLSKGYMYGRNNRPDKTKGGMDYNYTIPKLLERGTVPESMCDLMDEMPDIMRKLEALPDIKELDKEAEKYKINYFYKIDGDSNFYDNVKSYLYRYQMPMIGDMTRKAHCVVIIGWDGDELLYHDHKGRDTIYSGKFNKAYYLDGGVENMNMNDRPFNDVKETDWYYDDVYRTYDMGIMNGVASDEFAPYKPLTRAEFATVICRLIDMGLIRKD